ALVVPLAAAADAIGVGFADLVSPGMGGAGAAARGVFPFGLGEQAIVLAGHGREPSGVLARLQPGHVDDRTAAAPPAAVGNRIASADRDAGIPVVECQLEFGDRERRGDPDLVLTVLVHVAAFLARGRAHHELAWRNHDHDRTVLGAFLERVT